MTPALSCRDQFEPEASALQGQRSTADLPARVVGDLYRDERNSWLVARFRVQLK
jgi:hypothetical protein